MQLYRGKKPASSDRVTKYKAHIRQRNTGEKNPRSNVFTINLIFRSKLLGIILQPRRGSGVKRLPANASPRM